MATPGKELSHRETVIRWTKTQARILALLADGEPHTGEAVHQCLFDELGSRRNIHPHLVRIRKLLPPDETIRCVQINRVIHYQHVLLRKKTPSR